ncbi:MAG: hypothetical protein ACXWAT_00085 [Methylobacter sp.]
MSGGGSSAPANTTSSSTSNPWSSAAYHLSNNFSNYDPNTGQFVNNGGGPTGGYERAANYAQQYSQLSPEQTALINNQQNTLNTQNDYLNYVDKGAFGLGLKAANGAYNTNFGPVANAEAGQSTAAHSAAAQSNMQNNLASLGQVDPTHALSQVLSGQPNQQVIGSMNQANIDRSMQGYNDAIQNLTQQALPSINNDAFAAGQYGGSRQGIAQGLALQGMERNARDLGIAAMDSGNTLYGNAYQNAQNNMAQTANNLTGVAAQNGQYNASNEQQNNQFNASQDTQNNQFNAGQTTQNNQFNANLGTQNNTQQMQQQAQNLNNVQTGVNMGTGAMNNLFNGQDTLYSQQMQLAQMPQQQQLQALNAYLGAVSPGASAGSTTTNQATYFTANPWTQAAGLGAAGAGLISQLKG